MHAFVCSFIHLCIHSFNHSIIPSFVRSFVRSFIRSFVHSCIHSFKRSTRLKSLDRLQLFLWRRLCTDGRGRKYVDQVQCARVYHINVVLRIRTSTQDSVRGKDYKEKSMQIQRWAASRLPHHLTGTQSKFCYTGVLGVHHVPSWLS